MTEAELQTLIVRWLKEALPQGSCWHHSPNEGRRHVAFKRRLSHLGTRWGWPDLQIIVPRNEFLVPTRRAEIFIEVKTKKGRLTPNQREMLEQLKELGCYATQCRSIHEVEAFLAGLINLNLTKSKAGLIRQLEEKRHEIN